MTDFLTVFGQETSVAAGTGAFASSTIGSTTHSSRGGRSPSPSDSTLGQKLASTGNLSSAGSVGHYHANTTQRRFLLRQLATFLEPEDLARVEKTCGRIKDMVFTSGAWSSILAQRWPSARYALHYVEKKSMSANKRKLAAVGSFGEPGTVLSPSISRNTLASDVETDDKGDKGDSKPGDEPKTETVKKSDDKSDSQPKAPGKTTSRSFFGSLSVGDLACRDDSKLLEDAEAILERFPPPLFLDPIYGKKFERSEVIERCIAGVSPIYDVEKVYETGRDTRISQAGGDEEGILSRETLKSASSLKSRNSSSRSLGEGSSPIKERTSLTVPWSTPSTLEKSASSSSGTFLGTQKPPEREEDGEDAASGKTGPKVPLPGTRDAATNTVNTPKKMAKAKSRTRLVPDENPLRDAVPKDDHLDPRRKYHKMPKRKRDAANRTPGGIVREDGEDVECLAGNDENFTLQRWREHCSKQHFLFLHMLSKYNIRTAIPREIRRGEGPVLSGVQGVQNDLLDAVMQLPGRVSLQKLAEHPMYKFGSAQSCYPHHQPYRTSPRDWDFENQQKWRRARKEILHAETFPVCITLGRYGKPGSPGLIDFLFDWKVEYDYQRKLTLQAVRAETSQRRTVITLNNINMLASIGDAAPNVVSDVTESTTKHQSVHQIEVQDGIQAVSGLLPASLEASVAGSISEAGIRAPGTGLQVSSAAGKNRSNTNSTEGNADVGSSASSSTPKIPDFSPQEAAPTSGRVEGTRSRVRMIVNQSSSRIGTSRQQVSSPVVSTEFKPPARIKNSTGQYGTPSSDGVKSGLSTGGSCLAVVKLNDIPPPNFVEPISESTPRPNIPPASPMDSEEGIKHSGNPSPSAKVRGTLPVNGIATGNAFGCASANPTAYVESASTNTGGSTATRKTLMVRAVENEERLVSNTKIETPCSVQAMDKLATIPSVEAYTSEQKSEQTTTTNALVSATSNVCITSTAGTSDRASPGRVRTPSGSAVTPSISTVGAAGSASATQSSSVDGTGVESASATQPPNKCSPTSGITLIPPCTTQDLVTPELTFDITQASGIAPTPAHILRSSYPGAITPTLISASDTPASGTTAVTATPSGTATVAATPPHIAAVTTPASGTAAVAATPSGIDAMVATPSGIPAVGGVTDSTPAGTESREASTPAVTGSREAIAESEDISQDIRTRPKPTVYDLYRFAVRKWSEVCDEYILEGFQWRREMLRYPDIGVLILAFAEY